MNLRMKLVALCLVVLLLTSMVEPGECFFRRLKEKLTKTWNKYKGKIQFSGSEVEP